MIKIFIVFILTSIPFSFKVHSINIDHLKFFSKKYIVDATVYYPSIHQCDSDPLITATGDKINKIDPISHRWIAISRDLLNKSFSYGDSVFVSGTNCYDGIWIIKDCMNKRFKNKIDFLIGKNNRIDSWKNVQILKL
jgi:3D (Asp-Asp-Asp) domain-containing protein